MISELIATHFSQIFFGGNWTTSCVKEHITDVSWTDARKQMGSLNSIATLVYHINYYVSEVLKVLEGNPLSASDKFSFNSENINSEESWTRLKEKTFSDAEKFATIIEQFPDNKLFEIFVTEKYGTYYRNFHGIIEHTHYHLGQIVLIKKIIREQSSNSN